MPDDGPASITIERRVEWSDTDAAGHHHFTAVLRWAEQAETLLYERLGVADATVGRCPRVHIEADFTRRLMPRDVVAVRLAVERVGRSSVGYAFEVHLGEAVAARGRVAAVHVSPGAGAAPWPAHVRDALLHGGGVAGERYHDS